LLKNSDSNRPAAIKDLVDYLMMSRGSEHCEIILEKGVTLMTQNPEFMTVEHMYLAEEFFYSACELKQFEWAQFFLRMVRN
jgi:hypothetical protein